MFIWHVTGCAVLFSYNLLEFISVISLSLLNQADFIVVNVLDQSFPVSGWCSYCFINSCKHAVPVNRYISVRVFCWNYVTVNLHIMLVYLTLSLAQLTCIFLRPSVSLWVTGKANFHALLPTVSSYHWIGDWMWAQLWRLRFLYCLKTRRRFWKKYVRHNVHVFCFSGSSAQKIFTSIISKVIRAVSHNNVVFRNDTSWILAEIYRLFRDTLFLYIHVKDGQCMFFSRPVISWMREKHF